MLATLRTTFYLWNATCTSLTQQGWKNCTTSQEASRRTFFSVTTDDIVNIVNPYTPTILLFARKMDITFGGFRTRRIRQRASLRLGSLRVIKTGSLITETGRLGCSRWVTEIRAILQQGGTGGAGGETGSSGEDGSRLPSSLNKNRDC